MTDPTFADYLLARRISPKACYLYRHAGISARPAALCLSKGPESFLAYVSGQDEHRARQLVRRPYTAHFISDGAPDGGFAAGLAGISRNEGRYDIVAGARARADAERDLAAGVSNLLPDSYFVVPMRWVDLRGLEPREPVLMIDWGPGTRATIQRADGPRKPILRGWP